ncbi:MAG: hypothetical protein M3R46_04855 [Actinomycetota bacterium]|nr:hypothetical protein [Actinomycetota bacterium]
MTGDGERTASPGEVDVLWIVRTSDLPQPLVNAPVLGYVVDLLWPAQRLIVEVDSKRWHDGPFARQNGHLRQSRSRGRGLRGPACSAYRPAPPDPAAHPRGPYGTFGR